MSKQGKAIGLPVINAEAAGIDIGARMQVVAVPPDLCDEPVRTFQAFTADLALPSHTWRYLGGSTIANVA